MSSAVAGSRRSDLTGPFRSSLGPSLTNPDGYGLTGPKTVEAPLELVSVNVTAVKGTVVPGGALKVNCTVIVNWLPKALEAELPYQLVNAVVSGTVTSAAANCVLVGDVKWNSALVMLRGVE